MINKNQEDKGSIKNSNGIFKVSELIHENTQTTCSLMGLCSNSIKIKTETINEANTDKLAMVPDKPLLIFLPKNPFIKNPSKGNKGMSATNLIILFIYNVVVNNTLFAILLKLLLF